ncbi:MAG: peptidase M24 [Desulfobulbaceae bacterium A2]|nr:MAG: peptidase M24 [Desulfobulbaceae bacterium A2]
MTSTADETLTRLRRLRRLLGRRGLDALLVTQPENRRYLSGFRAKDHGIQESAGSLLVPLRGAPLLLTDSRFTLEAQTEAPAFRVELYRHGRLALLRRLLADLGIRRLGVEGDYTLYATALKLQALATQLDLELLPVSGLVEGLRAIKSEGEIERLRRAVHLNETVFQQALATIKPGMREDEVARLIENLMGEHGAEGPSFPTIVAGGENAAKPHAVPGARAIRADEPLLIDMGLILDGYCADMTRTVVLGTPDKTFLSRQRLVRQAQLAACAVIRAGLSCREADLAARCVLDQAGLGQAFGHSLGHGVGLAVHEEPRLNSRNRRQLKAGMVVTVEPGVYLPGWGGIRLENMAVVREDGCEILNLDTTMLDS